MSSTPAARPRRIAFAPARYGDDIVGGAEIVMGELARRLVARGREVEILTTCARDHFSWANEYPAGVTVEDGLTVRRFPVAMDNTAERGTLEHAILSGATLTLLQQQRWMNGGMRVPELFHHLLDHVDNYRALVFGPYPFWVAFACSQVAPERTLLWTCLHDEPYAYLDIFQPVFSGLAGLFFQTAPEHRLAHRIARRLAPHAEVGCGVEVPRSYDPEGFRKRYGVDGPFLLYAGRREGAKGWEELLEMFANALARASLPFSLVTMGGGPVRAPHAVRDRVVDLGFLPADERDNAFAAASAYVQPSRYEAFSRTMMEAWLAGTLVVGNGASDVVRWHVERSGAGLVYDDEYEFEQCLRFAAEAPETAEAVAASGRDYVLANYTWDRVLDNVEAAIARWIGE